MAEVEFLVNTNSGQLAYPGYVASELQRICEVWYDTQIGPKVAKAALTATIQAAVDYNVDLDKDHGLSWGTLLTCFCCNMDYQKSQGQLNTTRFQNMATQRAEVVKLLLAAGADPNARENWGKEPYWTPLIRAAWAGYVPQVTALLDDDRTDVNLRAGINNPDGDTALSSAVPGKHYEVARLLLEKGADSSLEVGGVSIFIRATANNSYGGDIASVFYNHYYRQISPNQSVAPAP